MTRIYILLIISFLFNACSKSFETIDGFTQGTTYHIIYERDGSLGKSPQRMKSEIEALFAEFDLSLSTYVPNSIISRINNNEEDVSIDEYFRVVFEKSENVFLREIRFIEMKATCLNV